MRRSTSGYKPRGYEDSNLKLMLKISITKEEIASLIERVDYNCLGGHQKHLSKEFSNVTILGVKRITELDPQTYLFLYRTQCLCLVIFSVIY